MFPAVWSGSASSFSILGGAPGLALGVAPGQVVGIGPGGGAAVWAGDPPTLVSLHNPAWYHSQANATSGQEQVGYYRAAPGQPLRAVMWRGTAQSVVNLHPAGAHDSAATSAIPGLQGGWARFGPIGARLYNAALWSGSAESFINLHPPGLLESQITGMVEGQQVGWASRPGGTSHAAMWHGSAASYIDMHPSWTTVSQILATCGSAQVGWANLGSLGGVRAGIWFGTPESFINLGQYLPPVYGESVATCVAFDGERYYVGGYAVGVAAGRRAFLWVGVPGPSTLALGTLALGAMGRRPRRGAASGAGQGCSRIQR